VRMGRRGLLIGGGAVVLGGASWLGWRQIGSADDTAAQAAALRQVLPATPESRDLIRYATLAANAHNTQAWTFRVGPTGVDILPDLARGTPVVDPDHHHLFISLGCAAENLSLAMVARGRGGEIAFDAAGEGVVHVVAGSTSCLNVRRTGDVWQPGRTDTQRYYPPPSPKPSPPGYETSTNPDPRPSGDMGSTTPACLRHPSRQRAANLLGTPQSTELPMSSICPARSRTWRVGQGS
jgi:hypothetical protein